MYDELIKALHDGAEFLECSTPGIKNSFAKMCHNAAEAIEELQQQVEHYHGCMNDWFEAAKLTCAEYEELTDCPLVPVSAHGRLIDADALIAWFEEWYDPNADLEICHVIDILDDNSVTPTIIEAEEGET